MAYHTLGGATTNVTQNTASFEIIGSTTIRARVLEIGFDANNTAIGAAVGIGRPAAAGITPTTPVTVVGEDANDAPATRIATAWATPPQLPAKYMRRTITQTGFTGGAIWRFFPGIVLETSGANNSLAFYNITDTHSYDFYVVVDEE